MKRSKLLKNGLRIRVQLLLILTVCITLFSFVVVFFAKWTAQNIVRDNLKSLTYTFQYDSGNEIDLLIKKERATAAIISQDESVKNFFTNGEAFSNGNINGMETVSENEICGIVVSYEDGLYMQNIYGDGAETPSESVFQKSRQLGYYTDLSKTYMTTKYEDSILLCYYTGAKTNGYILMYIRETAVNKCISGNGKTYETKLLTDEGICLSSADKTNIGKKIDFDQSNSEINKLTNIFSKKQNATLSTALGINGADTTVFLVNTVDYTVLYNQLYIMDSLTVFIAIIMLLALTGFTSFVSIKMVKPIENLKKSVSEYEGEKRIKIKHSRYNEIAELYDSFDEMTERIAQLIKTNQEEMERQRKLELAALQIQINPHFLYNTLDTVAWLAKMKKQPDIEKLVVSLARFFRISLHKGDKYITVFEEQELVKNYINIENIRFPEKIKVIINIDEKILGRKIVKIILQPIVENSIKHGFATLERRGTIVIDGYASGEDIIFEVTDDGVGFEVPENFLEKEYVRSDGPGGYGIKNVNERIKLEYGEDYGLTYQSEIGKGTKVTVRIKGITKE